MDHPVSLESQQKFSRYISEPGSHEIFLSHAGQQKPFVFDLYDDFVNWPRCPPIEPFFDRDEKSLPRGEPFAERIFEDAKNCVVAVLILTEEYVTSKWPMLELLAFVKAQETTNPGLKLLPVFYSVPTSLTVSPTWTAAWEKFSRPESAGRSITISVESCEKALQKLRKINGIVWDKYKPLKSLQEEIVIAALAFLPSSSEMDTENVQGCLRMCEDISKMLQKDERGVYCLGLYGLGGLGKTTMCRQLCSYFGPRLKHKVCHVEIGSNNTGTKTMRIERYKQILKDLSDMTEKQISICLNDSHKAEKLVHQCLSNVKKPKFLAVDNVQDTRVSQEEAGNYLSWISPGSIIIITSRSQENLRSVSGSMPRNPIPNLDPEEALTLFLKIAAPDVDRKAFDQRHIFMLEKCLQICHFSGKKDQANQSSADHSTVTGESGHYHPLALRAVASYFRERYSGPHSILRWKEELEARNILILHASDSIEIFDVLGLGFNDKNMCDLSKKLFIDVALFAPFGGDVFNWLVSLHCGCKPKLILEKLKQLKKKSFLSYDDVSVDLKSQVKAEDSCERERKEKEKGSPNGVKEDSITCNNISMHDLYRDFAKVYLGKKDEGLFKYGVYDDGYLCPPLEDPGWATVPRIYLQELTNVAKVREWRLVAVLHLIGCASPTTVSIGELVSLRSLTVAHCPKLEVLSWTSQQEDHTTSTKNQQQSTSWGANLFRVFIYSNKSLRKIPDFSDCAELQEIGIEGCSSSVEPIRFHNCSNLERLGLMGNDVPEVQSIQSCPKLRAVRLAWKATHRNLPLLDNLHRLSELEITGPSDVPFYEMGYFSPLMGEKQFWIQHPKESVHQYLPGAGVLENLRVVKLTCIPLGRLPVKLVAGGSSIHSLTLSGCLMSTSVDFSVFPNLQVLIVSWTNVEELTCGLQQLKSLEVLDCSYCFRLRKVPDLRPLPMLAFVFFIQCPKLQGIPRLPPECVHRLYSDVGFSEDEVRAISATLAFMGTTARALPPPGIHAESNFGIRHRIPSHMNGGWAIHVWVTCDGCRRFPIIGKRYKAKPVATRYSLCSNCFSKTCCCPDMRGKYKWKAEGKVQVDYDLCSACYARSGCDSLDFYEIDQTCLPEHGPSPKVTLVQDGSSGIISISFSGVSKRSRVAPDSDRYLMGSSVFSLKIKESPFNMTRRELGIQFGGL